MRRKKIALFAVLVASTLLGGASAVPSTISSAVGDTHRTPGNVDRDRYRHPAETLAFFGVRPDQTVVELEPANGWYTEILAPMLSERGHYIGLTSGIPRSRQAFAAALDKGGDRYRGATTATIDAATGETTVPEGSADVVLTFRNIHGFVAAAASNGVLEGVRLDGPALFRSFYRMLKPGGVLGVEDHRLPESADTASEAKSGYIKQSSVIRLAEQAGFRLAGESEINANPRDTHDWPAGVWTLPPTLRLGEKDRARYLEVGESDRMTLRFVKPAQ